MARKFGADSSVFQSLTAPLTDDNGFTLVDTSSGFGSSPLGVALREQVGFGLPNATFNLLPLDPTQPITEYDNPLPYWQIQTTPNITATATYDTTTQTWGVKVDPGTAPSGESLYLRTRSFVTTDDNLALRQRASLTLAKNGTYAGTSQWNLSLTAVYYDSANAPIGTTAIGTVFDNTTWTSISGTTTTGGSAIPASASWVEFTVAMTTTGTVSSSTSATLKSLLVATSTPAAAGGNFVIADEFTASGTWTRPTGVNYVTVVAVGGGGGGAGGGVRSNNTNVAQNSWGGPSGGSSSWAIIRDLYVGGETSISVGIGTAGVGGTAKTFSKAAAATTVNTGVNENSGNGGAGGATTFGTYLTIPGGGGAISQSTSGGAGTAGGAPTTTIFGIDFLGSVVGRDASSLAGNAGSASTFSQLPGWAAAFASGNAGLAGTSTGASVNYSGTAGAAGSAGIIGSGASGGRPDWNGTNYTANSTSGAIGGRGAGSGGGPAGAQIAATQTITVTAGAGGAAAANSGAGGGGGGGANVVASGTATYNPSTITATSGAGGNGAAGRLYVIYTG